VCLIFKSIDVLQFPHKSYLQNGYFFCVYVIAKKKLLVIRIFPNKQQQCTSDKTKLNRHDMTEILLKLTS
jgi:hypothetical protein